MNKRAPTLLIITDEEQCRSQARSVLTTLHLVLDEVRRSGAGEDVAVLLRDKRTPEAELLQRARAVRTLCSRAGARALIHTHVAVALDADLDGVHLDSASDVAKARAALGPERLLGASRHADHALDAESTAGLDYVTLSPVFAPTSKPGDARSPLGLHGLSAALEDAAVPVLGLGGLDALQAQAVLRAGAAGVAVLGAVMGAHAPQRVVSDLTRALGRAA